MGVHDRTVSNKLCSSDINKQNTYVNFKCIDSYVITISSTPSVSGTSGVAEVGGTLFLQVRTLDLN